MRLPSRRCHYGQHESGSANCVQRLNQLGAAEKRFGGKLGGLPIIRQVKVERKPADETPLTRYVVAGALPVFDGPLVIIPEELPLSLSAFQPKLWAVGAPGDDVFELACVEGHGVSFQIGLAKRNASAPLEGCSVAS